MIDGERRYFEDKVATQITYGRRPEDDSDGAAMADDEAPAADNYDEQENEDKKPVGVLAKIIEEGK